MTSESSEGLTSRQRADGTRMLNLEGQLHERRDRDARGERRLRARVRRPASPRSTHAKHAHDVEIGKAPKTLLRPTKQQPALEEK